MSRKPIYMILCAVVVMALSLPTSAQHYVGIKGGYGGANGRFYPAQVSEFTWNKYNGGVMWKYYSDQQIIGGVSTELEYQTRGYRVYNTAPGDSVNYISKTRIVNSIAMPLIWQPHLYFAKRKVRLFLNAGFAISYNLGIGDKVITTTQTRVANGNIITMKQSTERSSYKMITARDNRWNYGLCGGGGLGFLFGRCEIFAEARYYFGMSDIVRNKTKYVFNDLGFPGGGYQTIRSELNNLFITVGFFFRIGKGGILAPQLQLNNSNRKKARQSDSNDFRNIKLNL